MDTKPPTRSLPKLVMKEWPEQKRSQNEGDSMNDKTATKLSSRDDDLTIDARYKRAQAMTAHVMHAIGKYINDEERDYHREATRALLDLFYDNGVDIITDQHRADAGLPPRGKKGWTVQELHIMEMKRIEAMLKPMPPILVPLSMTDGAPMAED